MARKVFVLAVLFVAVVGVAMATEAPSSSPKSSPAPPSTPKASAPVAASPKSSPAPPTPSESSPVASPPEEEEDPIDFGAPAPGPSDEFMNEEEPAVNEYEEPASGASSLKVSAAVVAVAAGFFAF